MFKYKFQVVETPNKEISALRPDEVLVDVRSCGLNFYDIYIRQGLSPDVKPPCVLGTECAGIVKGVGLNVSNISIDDHVIVFCPEGGAMSDQILVTAGHVLRVPRSLTDFETLSALTINYLTAYLTIVKQGRLNHGDSILIQGAAGGVGWAATQIARMTSDVIIFGTASRSKHAAIKGNGVHYPISNDEDIEAAVLKVCPQGVSLILENMSGESLAKSLKLLQPLGMMIIIGAKNMIAGERRSWTNILRTWWSAKDISPTELIMKNQCAAGFNLNTFARECPFVFRETWERIVSLYEEGKIRPRIDSSFSFSEIREASSRLTDRLNVGKVVLRP